MRPADARREEFLESLRDLSKEELLALKARTDADLLDIRLQVERAIAQRQLTGERSDPDWFSRASAARRHVGWNSQMIQMELTKRNREIKQQNIEKWEAVGEPGRAAHQESRSAYLNSLGHHFIQITEDYLSPEEFQTILSQAKERARDSRDL